MLERGDVATAFEKSPAHIVSHKIQGPYQAHAPFGPNCALADVRSDSALVMCSTQDVYGTRNNIARILGMPPEKVRVQYYEGSGTYGHSCYDDVAQAAAILSQLAGKPVRLQFMRWDEHGWDNYGPAHIGEVRAAADAAGKIVAYEYHGWQHNWSLVETSEQLAIGKARGGMAGRSGATGQCAHIWAAMYAVPNLRLVNHQVPGAGFLKGGWLRSPLDLSFAFASEQAIDELAYRLDVDPLRVPAAEHHRSALARRTGGGGEGGELDSRGAPVRECSSAKVVTGRGIGARHAPGVVWRRGGRDRGE